MPALGRATVLLGFLLFGVAAGAQAQSPPKESKGTGSIAGRVTVDGKPKSGIEIVAQPEKTTSRSFVRATSDPGHAFMSAPAAPCSGESRTART